MGRSYEVTKVHEHFVDEIEGVDAAKWYEDILGREELTKDPNLAGIFLLINLFSEITSGMRFPLG